MEHQVLRAGIKIIYYHYLLFATAKLSRLYNMKWNNRTFNPIHEGVNFFKQLLYYYPFIVCFSTGCMFMPFTVLRHPYNSEYLYSIYCWMQGRYVFVLPLPGHHGTIIVMSHCSIVWHKYHLVDKYGMTSQ